MHSCGTFVLAMSRGSLKSTKILGLWYMVPQHVPTRHEKRIPQDFRTSGGVRVLLDGWYTLCAFSLQGAGSFFAHCRNGCYRTCDHLIIGTVSNWAGAGVPMRKGSVLCFRTMPACAPKLRSLHHAFFGIYSCEVSS